MEKHLLTAITFLPLVGMVGILLMPSANKRAIRYAAVAMTFKASAEDLARCVHAHPTLSEIMMEAALAVNKQAIHT